jgi:glycosyltransferase involved in cell wall biosynthesis
VILQIAVPSTSLGPRRAASHLAEALVADGFDARLVERPGRDGRLNAHLSNSSRSLLVPLAGRRDCLVTLHDVVPRDSRVRKALVPMLLRVLRRHRVVVHSRHAADLLRENGFDEPIGVVPLHLPVERPSDATRFAERSRLLRGHDGHLLVLAGQLRASKRVDELVRVAGSVPESRLVLLGKSADSATTDALGRAPGNVIVVEDPDDPTFSLVLAAADALLLPRQSSVGETSGPLVMAHALGTPAALLDSGSAPEYAVPADLDDQRAGLLAAYRREFESLGWT